MRIFLLACVMVFLGSCSDRDIRPLNSKSKMLSVVPETPQVVQVSDSSLECLSSNQIMSASGKYVKKETWEKVLTVKDWTSLNSSFTEDLIPSVDLTSEGEAKGSLRWHEGSPVCVQLRNGELWAKLITDSPNSHARWEGPYTYLLKGLDFERAYFDRIFQKECYTSEIGELWCFGPQSIQVGNKKFSAVLNLDPSEMPAYGTPVSVQGEKGFWIFLPFENGWKVFKDSFVTEKDHVDIDPRTSAPWHTLLPVSKGRKNSNSE